jgi:hypothetical protein
MVKRSECDHPQEARRQAILHDPDEATVCAKCSSMIYADGHLEPIGITRMSVTKR